MAKLMKHCLYCTTDYDISESHCSSCGAVECDIKCDNCGTIHNNAFCPDCGFGANELLKACPKCHNKTKERICSKCGFDVYGAASLKEAATSVVSKAACIIDGHKWLGCKCTRCGAVQDKGHTFEPIDGKCEHQCTVCQKTESIPHQWSGGRCIHCGTDKGFSDKLWTPLEKGLPFLHLEKTNNRIGVCLVFFMVIIIAFVGVMISLESKPNSNGEICLPSTSDGFKGQDYHDVVSILQKSGFTNIETSSLDDLINGWLTKENSVKTVTVDGSTEYNTNSRFKTDVKIVVSYHSFPLDDNNAKVETDTIIT